MFSKIIRTQHKKPLISSFKYPFIRSFSTQQYDVTVIGGGPGGYSCAIKAAQLGLKTACIEGRGKLGGTCLNVGCIPSKALLHNSHLYHSAKHDFAKRGILVDNLRIDLNKLMATKDQAVDGLTKGIEGLFKKNKVTYIKGWGKITSKNEVSVKLSENDKEEKISSKYLVIATGSVPSTIPGVELDEEDIVSSTGAIAFSSIPQTLIVVGAGVIGLELGSVWGRLGSKVTVVEYLDRILPGTDLDMSKKFQRILAKQGFDFKLSNGVKTIKKGSKGYDVTIEDRNSKKTEVLTADKVLVAIGRKPFTDGLGLKEVGIAMDGAKVATNDHWQSTSHSNIYAIGDVIKGPMLAHKAEEEGIAVAEILGGKSGHVNYDAIPGVIYTYPEVAFVGKTEEQLKEAGIEFKKGEFPFMANSRARTNDEAEGYVKILGDKKTDRLLGVHIIGPNAGEMIAEGVVGLEYGASTEDLGRTTHAHPTLSEAFKEACMLVYDKPIHI